LYACNSKQEETQGYGKGNGGAVAMELSEPPPFEEKVMFTTPIIAADEEVVKADNSNSETLGDKITVSKKKIIKDGNISVKTNDIIASKKALPTY
jgi:hypothetical protein